MDSCLGALQVSQGAVAGNELTRGLAGEPLTVGDNKLLELKPLKAFLPGEVCLCFEVSGCNCFFKHMPRCSAVNVYRNVVAGWDSARGGDKRASNCVG